ncbi:zinc ribbon domain-containing protein [Bacillus cereus]|uniref:zinc ribbon domain-containing protein n=1 Tax=Bacillus cereus TaxID=1396 RepID=UPI001155AD77|nr:zinc ribbon domain-containing protein [Bacillus cereus]
MSWSQFQTILKYKVKWCSEQLAVISKTFTSSQLCSNCNYKNIDAKNLIIRE